MHSQRAINGPSPHGLANGRHGPLWAAALQRHRGRRPRCVGLRRQPAEVNGVARNQKRKGGAKPMALTTPTGATPSGWSGQGHGKSIRPAGCAVEEGTAYCPKIGEVPPHSCNPHNKGGLTWLTTSFAFTQVPVIGRLSNCLGKWLTSNYGLCQLSSLFGATSSRAAVAPAQAASSIPRAMAVRRMY